MRRGVYRLDGGDGPASAVLDHTLRARAAAPGLSSEAVFGHVTAAVLLGLPVWAVPLDRLHVVRSRPTGARTRGDLVVRSGTLLSDEIVDGGGLRVTGPARTLVDLARSVPTEQALVVADGALQAGAVAARTGRPRPDATTPGEIAAALTRATGTKGVGAARRTLALADPASESPGESRSRFRMHVAGVPAPVTQWPVPGTRFRADFAWPDLGLVGEFDGRTKYGRTLRPGADATEALWEEKRREDRIRRTGLSVVRWTWQEITDPGPHGMITTLRQALRT
ncbi:hypothetical protein WHI96_01785 [Pseudonocardia tropica]|uniref:Transcriptional regulator, AbiEi antitoxin, Type IV TA system n=1 Tax=Pseudonocardia tropica TaxID=681289 RepID=A0ABV1JRH7_9PSEU